ncbi:hypothetical protein [Reyranella sp.]|uniref:hypothetical protein n=1 Tax=Reyranella sp. TaxID=1929291 RepID=UPI003F72455A
MNSGSRSRLLPLLVAGLGLLGSPALAQGPMGPGGGGMTPQPRVAPPPPPPPPPPPVMVPVAPGLQPGAPAGIAPRTGSASGSDVQPQAPVQPAPVQTTPVQPAPRDRPPATTKTTTTGTAPAVPSVTRSTALVSATKGLRPARDVPLVSTDDKGGNRTQLRTDGKGQFSLGTLAPGVRDIALPLADLQRALPTGTRRLPSVTVSLVVPAAPGAGPRGNLVVHTYVRPDPKKDIRARITVPRNGGGTIVDWGDGTPPVDTVRDGWPVNVGGGRGPVDTIGTVSFVRKFEKMGFIQMDPCTPWWQCAPPPDPDPPPDLPPEDPWTEILPEGDPPPDDPIIEIVELDDPPKDDPPKDDPPRDRPPWEDPPKDDPPPPQIGEKGTFDVGPLRPGVREIRLGLPIAEPPRPPVKVALLLPVEPRAAVEALNAGGRPPRVGEKDRLHLVEHIYAPDTTAQTLRVRISMAKDGSGALVDWGDGTPVTDVKRDGKPIAAASVDREAVGRILFLGSKKKQP